MILLTWSFSEKIPPLESTKDKIIKLLKENPNYTIQSIADRIGKSRDTIKEHLNRLKRDNIIKRVGSTKSGHWEIINE